jgi:dihydrofolate reductase
MSLPDAHRPLPNRRNIVLTRKPIAGIETYTSIDDMLDILGAEGVEHIWVMGGAAIYDEFFQR